MELKIEVRTMKYFEIEFNQNDCYILNRTRHAPLDAQVDSQLKRAYESDSGTIFPQKFSTNECARGCMYDCRSMDMKIIMPSW